MIPIRFDKLHLSHPPTQTVSKARTQQVIPESTMNNQIKMLQGAYIVEDDLKNFMHVCIESLQENFQVVT